MTTLLKELKSQFQLRFYSNKADDKELASLCLKIGFPMGVFASLIPVSTLILTFGPFLALGVLSLLGLLLLPTKWLKNN